MSFSVAEKTVATFKSRYGVNHTAMSNAEWFSELFEVRAPTYGAEVWLELTPGTNYYANHDAGATLDADIRRTRQWNGATWSSVSGGDVIPVERIIAPLAQLTATNKQAHMSLATPQASIDPPDVAPLNRLRDYIRFTDFGTDFLPRIFWDNGSGTAPGAEITTLALPDGWAWDADAGILLCGADSNNEFIPTGNLPIWIQHYRYIGTKGAGGGGATHDNHIRTDFDFSNVPGNLLIGTCPAGMVVGETAVNIVNVFNNGTTITVGDAVAQGRFLEAADVFTDYEGIYESDPHFSYDVDTEVRIYFPSGTPTQGTGEVIVYLS